MKRGLLFVAFGKDYETFAANSLKYSRQFTDLPFHVLTNVKKWDRCSVWAEVSNCEFKYFDLPTDQNRLVKTNMYQHTPFDETLYLDVGAVIRNKGIDKIFDLIETGSIVLNKYLHWGKGEKIINLYKKCMTQFRSKLPLDVYNGALIGFNKSPKVNMFFEMWYRYWRDFGKGREMPPLACAVQNTGINVVKLPKGYYEPDIDNPKTIIQNTAVKNLYQQFNLPMLNKTVVMASREEWSWVQL